MQQIAMINDKILPYEALDPIYLDRGFYFGDGVYEVIRSYNSKIFALEDHLKRFSNSLSAIGINSVDIEEVREKVIMAYKQSEIPDARIYFHITRGSAPRNHTYNIDMTANFFLVITELADNSNIKKNGIAVSTFPDWRWKRCDIKSLNLLANVLARQDAALKGCQEAILVDETGLITEGAASCFFAIRNGMLRTTPLGRNILPSITRKYVLKTAKNINLKFEEKSLTPAEAACADELFMAVTTKDVVPIVKFDDKIISDGKPGLYTKQIIKEFRAIQEKMLPL